MKLFNRIFHAADQYAKTCRWTDFALVKFCLCALGVLIGSNLSKEQKKTAQTCAILVFIATYVPLMIKFFPFVKDEFSKS